MEVIFGMTDTIFRVVRFRYGSLVLDDETSWLVRAPDIALVSTGSEATAFGAKITVISIGASI